MSGNQASKKDIVSAVIKTLSPAVLKEGVEYAHANGHRRNYSVMISAGKFMLNNTAAVATGDPDIIKNTLNPSDISE